MTPGSSHGGHTPQPPTPLDNLQVPGPGGSVTPGSDMISPNLPYGFDQQQQQQPHGYPPHHPPGYPQQRPVVLQQQPQHSNLVAIAGQMQPASSIQGGPGHRLPQPPTSPSPSPSSTPGSAATSKQSQFSDQFIEDPDPSSSTSFVIRCGFCSNLSKTKSDFWRHLSERHYKSELQKELPASPPFRCPFQGCAYETKDNTISPLIKHYGIVHKQVQKYLSGKVGKYVPSELKPPSAKSQKKAEKEQQQQLAAQQQQQQQQEQQRQAAIQQQQQQPPPHSYQRPHPYHVPPEGPPTHPPAPHNGLPQQQQQHPALTGPYTGQQPPHPAAPGHMQQHHPPHSHPAAQEQQQQQQLTMSNQSLKVKCPFCDLMFAAKYSFHQHLCDKHFKEDLSRDLPTSAPLACPAQNCNYVAKDSRQSLIRHYGMTHKVVVELLKQYIKGYDENEHGVGGAQLPQQHAPPPSHPGQAQPAPQHGYNPPPQQQQQQQHHYPHHSGHPPMAQQPQGGLPPMNEFYPPTSAAYGGDPQQQQQHPAQPPPHMMQQHPQYAQGHPPPHAYQQQPQQPPHAFEQQQIDGTFDPSHYSDHSMDGKSMPSTPQKDGSVSSNSPTNLPAITTAPATAPTVTTTTTTTTAASAAPPPATASPSPPTTVTSAANPTPAAVPPPAPPTPTPSTSSSTQEQPPSSPQPPPTPSSSTSSAAPSTPSASNGRRPLSPPKVCEICGKVFEGKNRAMLKVQHMARHFRDELFADLPTKTPPYRCPIEGCPYETKHKPDWARHYGSVHKYLDKYLKEYLETHEPHPNWVNPPPRTVGTSGNSTPSKTPKKEPAAAPATPAAPTTPAPPPAEVKEEPDDGKYSTFLPKDHLSQIINTAMNQQSQVGKDFGVITVGGGLNSLGQSKPPQLPPSVPQQNLPPPIQPPPAVGPPPPAQVGPPPPADIAPGDIEPSANQLELIDQVLMQTSSAGKSHDVSGGGDNGPLTCFMCEKSPVFKTEDELTEHINANHPSDFDLFKNEGDDDLGELPVDDLDPSLDLFNDIPEPSAAASSSSSSSAVPAPAAASSSAKRSSASRSSGSSQDRRNTGRPCEICGYEPKTKNKSRERQDHLAMKHYRQRIEEDLKDVTSNYKCPICEYVGKDKQTIYRHYTGKHKVVESYLQADIDSGKVIPLAVRQQQQAAAAGIPTPTTVAPPVPAAPQQPVPPSVVQQQVPPPPTVAVSAPAGHPPSLAPPLQPPASSESGGSGDQIMQVDGADDLEDMSDDEEEGEVITQVDGTLEDDGEEDAEEELDSSLNDSGAAKPSAASAGGVIRSVCPLCHEETKMHRTYHLATRHFKARLVSRLPTSKPFNCIECDFESKTRNNLWTHYMGRHKYTKRWIEEYRKNPEAFIRSNAELERERTASTSSGGRPSGATPKSASASASAAMSLGEDVIAPRLYGGQGVRKDFWCDLCQETVSNSNKPIHFAVVHYEAKLRKILPTTKPHWCPLCRYEAKHFLNLSAHFFAKHDVLRDWIRESLEELTEAKVREAEEERSRKEAEEREADKASKRPLEEDVDSV